MNRELKRVTIVALLMFLALFVSSTIIQYVQADALAADPRNSRTLYESYSVERGPILVGGEPIAYSTPSDDNCSTPLRNCLALLRSAGRATAK